MSCSKDAKKTDAKLKLNLSGITNIGNGIGNGGAILFGKSSSGEHFGKLINSTEENLELANGDWVFYAFMWERTGASNFSETVYCAKAIHQLNGTAVSIGLNLTNATCAGSEFSADNHYIDGLGKVRFANFFMEECDELGQANSFTCQLDNQGSALSYRLVFKSYRKLPGALPAISNEALFSQCVPVVGGTNVFSNGMGVNFPLGKSAMPFVVAAEMFLGSSDCGVTTQEVKGVYTHLFQRGLMSESSPENIMVSSTGQSCSTGPSNKVTCENYLGYWTGSSCVISENILASFLPVAECVGGLTSSSVKHIKQMVRIPKSYLCRDTNYALMGSDVFPGGNGSIRRPYKICSEWQLNQIGEVYSSSAAFANSSFKLMNDLDMNNADFNAPARPSCVGVAGSLYKSHHNLNPFGQITMNGCTVNEATAGTSFIGTFNGNNKTISHGRILVSSAANIGFIRNVGSNAVIKNLNFVNLEVEGDGYVGGIVGQINGSNTIISNVTINGGYIEGNDDFVGGAVGSMASSSTISAVKVKNVEINGTGKIGGLVGLNDGVIEKSMFRGKIRQHNLMDGQVGGLVGEATATSSITRSFSEGQIESSLKWIGGIAGINAGTINHAYSNMFLLSKYGGSGLDSFVGGITGSNQTGAMTNVYFNGKQVHKGPSGGVVTLDGISASGNTPTNCLSTSPLPFSSGCTSSSPALIRAGNTSLSGLTTDWKADVASALPRLKWEFDINSRACVLSENLASISSQVASGRGTFLLPVIVCTPDQLKTLAGTPAGRYVALGEDINIESWTSADLISSFSGILDGRKNSIYGLELLDLPDSGDLGIFKINSGTISNLNFIGNTLSRLSNSGNTGIVTGTNSGYLKKIYMFSNDVQIELNNVGSVAGYNTGTIDSVVIHQGYVIGLEAVGGVVGNNLGQILRVSANVGLDKYDTTYSKFGGIAGFNQAGGLIDQCEYGGKIYFPTPSIASYVYLGGLAGYNAGTIRNSMTTNHASLYFSNTSGVGGITGKNASGATIEKTLVSSKLIYHTSPVPGGADIGQLAGENYGSIDTASTFYLENKAGGFVASVQADYCSVGTMVALTNPSFLMMGSTDADLVENINFSDTSNSLKNLVPFSITANYQISYSEACSASSYFDFYKSYEPSAVGKKTIANFADINQFTNFDIAYESGNPATERNVARLLEYYKARMDGRAPTLTPPIWELEVGKHPRLVQIED